MIKIESKFQLLLGISFLVLAVYPFLSGESPIPSLFFGPFGVGYIFDSIFSKKGYLNRAYNPSTWATVLILGIAIAYTYIFQPVYAKDPFFYFFIIIFVFLLGLAIYEPRRMEKYQKEVEPYENAIEANPEDVTAWNNKGAVIAKFKAFQEAMDCFDKVLKIDPDDAAALHNKSVSLKKLMRHLESIKYRDKALELDPEFENAKRAGKIILEN